MPHALQSILGPMGPLRHMGVLPLPQHAQHFKRFATGRLLLPLPLLGGGVGCQSSWSSLGATCITCIHPPPTHQATNHFELLARRRRCERHRFPEDWSCSNTCIPGIAVRVSQSRPQARQYITACRLAPSVGTHLVGRDARDRIL